MAILNLNCSTGGTIIQDLAEVCLPWSITGQQEEESSQVLNSIYLNDAQVHKPTQAKPGPSQQDLETSKRFCVSHRNKAGINQRPSSTPTPPLPKPNEAIYGITKESLYYEVPLGIKGYIKHSP